LTIAGSRCQDLEAGVLTYRVDGCWPACLKVLTSNALGRLRSFPYAI